MPSNTFRQILLNETSSRLQSTSRKIKSNVTVISQMRRTILQEVKVLFNHKISYILNLWYLCNWFFVEFKHQLKMMTAFWRHWWQLIFSAWNFYHICQMTNSIYRRMVHAEDEIPPNIKSHAYHFSITYNGCELFLLTPPPPPAIVALPKCIFKGLRL